MNKRCGRSRVGETESRERGKDAHADAARTCLTPYLLHPAVSLKMSRLHGSAML